MLISDLRKSDRVRLANGWTAVIMDNKRGATRFAEVHGIVTECGSVYSHDIMAKFNADGTQTPIEHTSQQIKLRTHVRSIDAMIEVGGA